jgi:DNA-binding MarR family transcriptional regulator
MATADARDVAEEFGRLFPAVYLRFHRRDAKRSGLSSASRAVLQHLALTGPLTVGELGAHLDRTQSVVSEQVAGLEGKGLVERMPDPADGRRRLVWLSEEGLRTLDRDRSVLCEDLLERAVSRMSLQDRNSLLESVRALLAADDEGGRS